MNQPTHGGNLAWAGSIALCPSSAILDFSASINPLGPPSLAIATLKKGIKKLNHYPNPDYKGFCDSVANHHQVNFDQVLPGNGAAELLTWAAWELSKLEEIFIPNPGFADYERALTTFVDTKQINFYNLDSLKEGLKPSKKAGLIINNPHNPTGKVWTIDEILPYLKIFNLVIIDEAFMDFLLPSQQQSLIPFISEFDNLIILRSLTKFYSLPGLRLGYAVSNAPRIEQWKKWRDPWSVNTLAALVGEVVINDHKFQQKTWDWLTPTRDNLYQQLKSISYLKPHQGVANFLLVESEKSCSELQLFLLKNHHILIRNCLNFSTLGDHFFRICIRKKRDNQKLIKALKMF